MHVCNTQRVPLFRQSRGIIYRPTLIMVYNNSEFLRKRIKQNKDYKEKKRHIYVTSQKEEIILLFREIKTFPGIYKYIIL